MGYGKIRKVDVLHMFISVYIFLYTHCCQRWSCVDKYTATPIPIGGRPFIRKCVGYKQMRGRVSIVVATLVEQIQVQENVRNVLELPGTKRKTLENANKYFQEYLQLKIKKVLDYLCFVLNYFLIIMIECKYICMSKILFKYK